MAQITLSGDIAPFGESPSVADWGPLVGAVDVDKAIRTVLTTWLPTYCAQVQIDYNLDYAIAEPQSYAIVLDEDEYLDWAMPAVLISTAKTIKTIGGSNSNYEATWRTAVSGMIRGRNAEESKVNASYFEGAIRRCMLQKCRTNSPSPSGADGQDSELIAAGASILSGCHWQSTELAAVNGDKRRGRYLSVGIGTYSVVTNKAVQSFGGPNTPNAAPYEGLPTVSNGGVTISVEPITGD